MNYISFTIPLDNFPFLQIRHHNFWLIYRCKILVIGLYAHILWPGIEGTLLCHIICDMGPCILQSCPIKGKSSLDARGYLRTYSNPCYRQLLILQQMCSDHACSFYIFTNYFHWTETYHWKQNNCFCKQSAINPKKTATQVENGNNRVKIQKNLLLSTL